MTISPCTIDGKPFVCLRDEPIFSTTITEHNVEGKANASDHQRPNLDKLTLEGIVSALDGYDVEEFHELLRGLKDTNRRPVPIVTPFSVWDAMLLESYRPKFTKENGQALHFVTEWKEFNVTNTLKQEVQVRRQAQVKKGKQQTQTTPVRRRSAFKAVVKAASDI